MIAVLENAVGVEASVALGRAVLGFERREWVRPAWVDVGEGVALPGAAVAAHGLLVVERGCRPGHVLVGRDERR